MIDIRIHIENPYEIFDEQVFIDCKLPSVPTVGSVLHLTNELEIELENKCLNSNTKMNYHPNYFYGRNQLRLSFDDCINVKYVKYVPNSKYVTIVLGF